MCKKLLATHGGYSRLKRDQLKLRTPTCYRKLIILNYLSNLSLTTIQFVMVSQIVHDGEFNRTSNFRVYSSKTISASQLYYGTYKLKEFLNTLKMINTLNANPSEPFTR